MPMSFSHLGEAILAEMADRKRYDILRTFGLDDVLAGRDFGALMEVRHVQPEDTRF